MSPLVSDFRQRRFRGNLQICCHVTLHGRVAEAVMQGDIKIPLETMPELALSIRYT